MYAAVKLGIINGKSADLFAPDDDITLAEAVTLAARYHQILTSGEVTLAPGNPWYEPYMDYAMEHFPGGADIFQWDSRVAELPIMRGNFADLFYNMLPDSEYISINAIDDGAIPDIGMSHRYAESIYAFYRAGILAGSDAARAFLPDSYITRAETAVVLTRITNASQRVRFDMDSGGRQEDGNNDGNTDGKNGADSADKTNSNTGKNDLNADGAKTMSAVWNNGGHYVKYGADVYYRQYSADSFESSGVWDYFDPIPGAASRIMRRRADGSVEEAFKDDGHGPIYIARGYGSGASTSASVSVSASASARLVMNRLVNGFSTSGNYPIIEYEVYSVALDGGGKQEYGKGQIFAVDDDNGFVLVEDSGKLVMIDIASGKRSTLNSTAPKPIFYDQNSKIIYCEEYTVDSDYFTIYALNAISGSETMICEIPKSTLYAILDIDMMMEWYEYHSISVEGGYLLAYLASYGGTGQMYYNSALLKVRTDGSFFVFEANPREQDWYGIRKPFQRWLDGPFRATENGGDYFIIDDSDGSAGGVSAGDGVFFVNVLSEADMRAIGLDEDGYYGEDDFVSLRDIEYVDGELWFTVHTGPRNKDKDIGWRYGYSREKSNVYMKDLRSGAIALIYSY